MTSRLQVRHQYHIIGELSYSASNFTAFSCTFLFLLHNSQLLPQTHRLALEQPHCVVVFFVVGFIYFLKGKESIFITYEVHDFLPFLHNNNRASNYFIDLIALRHPLCISKVKEHRNTVLYLIMLPSPHCCLLSLMQLVLCMKKICITPSRISENWLILIDILNLPVHPWGNPVSIKRYRITNKTWFLVDLSKNFWAHHHEEWGVPRGRAAEEKTLDFFPSILFCFLSETGY